MRINRQKRVNKCLNFYCNNFRFRKPFQVLIDGTFCHAALKNKINIKDQLTKYLQGDVKFVTTQCIILETEKLGSSVYGAMLVAKQFPVHKCGHEKKPVTGSSCLESMIGVDNPNRYILATQDRDLQKSVERVPGVPVLFIYNKAPTLQKPSRLSLSVAENARKASCGLSKNEKKTIKVLKRTEFGPQITQIRKKKKKGGPNPLSCKKKKKKPQQKESSSNP